MLKNKIVFVSGGTGNIGSAICHVCSEYGATVLFSYNKNEEKAAQLKRDIKGSTALQINLKDTHDIQMKIEKLYTSIPVIDVLINNAAVSHMMPLAMLDEEDFDHIIDVNIKGTLFLTKAIIKGMIRNRKGSIINIGSIAGQRILDVPVSYAMTKSALVGFTYALASEMKRFGIRVNSVAPGLIEGGVSQGVPAELREDFIKHCAAGRAGRVREVAETVCFLASDKASYINGQNISVDGGI